MSEASVVIRPNEDDKRQKYDASTARKGATELGERSMRETANLFSPEDF